MFGYYTALLIVTLSIIFSAIFIIYNDNILEKFSRNIFIGSFIILIFIIVFEWISVYLENINSSLHYLSVFSMGVVLFLSPTITAILSLGINDKKNKLLSTVVISIVIINFIVGFSGLFSDAIFYFDEQNIYHRGNYFPIYLVMLMLSAITLFINTFRIGLKFQYKNNYIIILDFILFIGVLFIQFAFDGIWILWTSYTIAIGFAYIYYSSLVNQVDILTGILNRKCYESQLYFIKSDAILLIFDVNKFKEINDTLGHAAGDYCLIEIASAIKNVYGKSGYCYRIGGDEFSVILFNNLDTLEELNAKFMKQISENKYEMKLPSVSIGYSYYYPNRSSIQEVIEEADSKMYSLKQQGTVQDTILE